MSFSGRPSAKGARDIAQDVQRRLFDAALCRAMNSGATQLSYNGEVPDDIVEELKAKGYTVSPFGGCFLYVSWGGA